jgi:hypothetical protein
MSEIGSQTALGVPVPETIRQLFNGLIKCWNSEIEEVLERLQGIEESIETIAHEICPTNQEREVDQNVAFGITGALPS